MQWMRRKDWVWDGRGAGIGRVHRNSQGVNVCVWGGWGLRRAARSGILWLAASFAPPSRHHARSNTPQASCGHACAPHHPLLNTTIPQCHTAIRQQLHHRLQQGTPTDREGWEMIPSWQASSVGCQRGARHDGVLCGIVVRLPLSLCCCFKMA